MVLAPPVLTRSQAICEAAAESRAPCLPLRRKIQFDGCVEGVECARRRLGKGRHRAYAMWQSVDSCPSFDEGRTVAPDRRLALGLLASRGFATREGEDMIPVQLHHLSIRIVE